LTATEFEPLGEFEDEFEEEAAELEPFFSRGKPIPVAHPAPKAVYLGDLGEKFEDEALELEPLSRRRGTFEFEWPTAAPRPAPNELDPDAAESIFSGRVRLPGAPGAQARKTPAPQRTPTKAQARPLCSPSTAEYKNWSTIKIDEKAILPYKIEDGKMKSTDCAVNVPDVLKTKTQIDLLVFFHGLIMPCQPCFDPDPSNTLKKFGLDAQIHGPKRPVVVAVPRLFWRTGDNGANVAGSWTGANFNKFVRAVLKEVGKQSSVARTLGNLIIAGHSHAHAILTPLAREFYQGTAATTTSTEPLAKLTEVWAMDSTYSPLDVRALETWASKVPKARFFVLYSQKAVGRERFYWLKYYNVFPGFGPPSNLTMCVVPEEHCEIPTKYIGELLSATKHPPDWCKS
jgi:hypothetical protein